MIVAAADSGCSHPVQGKEMNCTLGYRAAGDLEGARNPEEMGLVEVHPKDAPKTVVED